MANAQRPEQWTNRSVYDALIARRYCRTPQRNRKQYVCITEDQQMGITSMILFAPGDEYRKGKPFVYDETRPTFRSTLLDALQPCLGASVLEEYKNKHWHHCEVVDWNAFAQAVGLPFAAH